MKKLGKGKTIVNLIIALCIVLLIGCSSKPKLNSLNEINEPIFHTTNHATIGTAIGSSFSDRTIRNSIFDNTEPKKYEPKLYIEPTFSYNVNVSNWANYQIWPLFWTILVTGEQYIDSTQLKTRNINLTIEGGVSGIYYSQTTGLTTSLSLAGTTKYLFSSICFNQTFIQYEIYNTKIPQNSITSFGTKSGVQITENNSVSLTYNYYFYNIPENSSLDKYGIAYFSDENSSEIVASHSAYLFKKIIFGPEVLFGFGNFRLSSGNYFKLGIHFLYLFS